MNINIKSNKGFTLIEMLVVIAIVAILSAIVLVAVDGFQANARDTARIGDLKNVQDYLQLYYNACGNYPDPAITDSNTACNATALTTWAEMSSLMSTAGITSNFPSDPDSPSRSFCYAVGDNGLDYALGAVLEGSNSVLNTGNNGVFPADITTGWNIDNAGQPQCTTDGSANTYIVSSS